MKSKKSGKKNLIYHYTSLPVLLDVLVNKRITLKDPKYWEDKNDSYYLEKYKQLCGFKSVLAICFTESQEKFHHWKVFSGNIGGICVHFYKEELLSAFRNNSNLLMDKVCYRTIEHLSSFPPSISILPFLKRVPYKDEDEFRIIYQNKRHVKEFEHFNIPVTCIAEIRFNPWLPGYVFDSISGIIKSIDGFERIPVTRTTLLENEKWKEIADQIA